MATELKLIPDIINPMSREVGAPVCPGDRSGGACYRPAAERVKKSEGEAPTVSKIDRR